MITSSDPRVTYSDLQRPKVTYSDPKVTYIDRELGRKHEYLRP